MTRAVGAVVAHFPDTEGVTSSNLVSPTKVEAIRLDITEEPSIRAIGAAASALRSHRRGRRFDSYIFGYPYYFRTEQELDSFFGIFSLDTSTLRIRLSFIQFSICVRRVPLRANVARGFDCLS